MDEMSKIVRTVTRFLYAFILVYGFYIIVHGHLTPGGGFQGGAVVASGFALLLVAFGASAVGGRIKEILLSVSESFGALSFISLAFAGLGTVFFYNFLQGSGNPVFGGNLPSLGSNPGAFNTSGTIALMNFAVGLKVLAGLGTVVVLMTLAVKEEREE